MGLGAVVGDGFGCRGWRLLLLDACAGAKMRSAGLSLRGPEGLVVFRSLLKCAGPPVFPVTDSLFCLCCLLPCRADLSGLQHH